MNGYVQFVAIDGEPLAINVDLVSFVRRFRGTTSASAINFEKGNYIVVNDSLEAVAKALQDWVISIAMLGYPSPRRQQVLRPVPGRWE
jgi:uncharacterized protein YlzI (FlbEa/FlbD family)